MPASTMEWIFSALDVAGPSVATILVRRFMDLLARSFGTHPVCADAVESSTGVLARRARQEPPCCHLHGWGPNQSETTRLTASRVRPPGGGSREARSIPASSGPAHAWGREPRNQRSAPSRMSLLGADPFSNAMP